MFTDEIIGVVARAIQSEVAHPLGSMRLLPETEQELAVAILNALDESGFDIVRREQKPTG
jgi:hypothetical protein